MKMRIYYLEESIRSGDSSTGGGGGSGGFGGYQGHQRQIRAAGGGGDEETRLRINELQLDLEEKMTIRVIAPRKLRALQDFVGKYSICPVVEEVQITWGHTKDAPPTADSFTYSKTHSTVVFEQVNNDSGDWPPSHYSSSLPVKTEAVMLLDADVLIDCEDLKFVQSVWRSGRETMVGVLPRIHMKWTYDDGREPEYTYHGWSRVWWNSAYSLMLSGAAVVHRDLLQQTRTSQSLVNLLSENPECHNVALSMWISSKHRNPLKDTGSSDSGALFDSASGASTTLRPPVWAQVKVNRRASSALAASAHVDDTEKSKWAARGEDHPKATTCQCLTMLAKALEIEDLAYVRSKAVVARKKFFW